MSRSSSFRPAAVLAGAALMLAGCAGFVRQQIYHPEPEPAAATPWPGRAPEIVSVTTADGLTLTGAWWAPSAPGRDVIVYFHGNAGSLDSEAHMAEPLARDGRGLMVVNYRGFGANPGRPTRAGLVADAEAFMAEARRRAPGSPLVLFGYSLGAAVALETAPAAQPRLVILLGGFSRIEEVAPWYGRPFLPDRWDNTAAIRRVEAPVIILHGTADQTIPFANGERLHAAAPDRSRLIPLNGAPHRFDLGQITDRLSALLDAADPLTAGPGGR